MYKIIIRGMAAKLYNARSNTDNARKVNRILLDAHVKSLNFSAKSSIRDTNNSEDKIVIIIRDTGVKRNEAAEKDMKGSPVINNALAGVGRPLNECVCVSSMLNLASLSAENTAISNATKGRRGSVVTASS